MTISHQKFREIVFLALYSLDVAHSDSPESIPLIMEQLSVTRKNVMEAHARALAILGKLQEIDLLIAEASLSYEFERIQLIERNVLRLGVFELFYDEKIPPKVAIAEAIRLAKKFGTPAATAFINAILDALYKRKLGIKADQAAIEQSAADLKISEELSEKAMNAKDEPGSLSEK